MKDFWQWLKGDRVLFATQIAVWVSGLVSLVAFFANLREASGTTGSGLNLTEIRTFLVNLNQSIQVLLIIGILWFFNHFHRLKNIFTTRVSIYYKRINNRPLTPEYKNLLLRLSEKSMSVFLHWWRFFWATLLGIYTIEVISGAPLSSLKAYWINNNGHELLIYFIDAKRILETLINNIGALAIFACFTIIHSPFSSKTELGERGLTLREQREKIKEALYLFVFPLFLITLFHAISIIHVSILNLTNPLYLKNCDIDIITHEIEKVDLIFRIISGVINCVILSLLVGRLDSKFIHTPSFLISVLYIYAAIQIGFLFFNNDSIKVYVIYLALFFKLYLFLIITFIIRTGRLSDMFMIFPSLENLVEKAWDEESEKTKSLNK